jgi:DNA polymerase I
MAKTNKKLVLLDVHAIVHRAYHALPDFMNSKGLPTGALYGLSTMLLKIISDIKPDYIIACYDLPKPTYRHEAYKDYKAGRAKTDGELVEQLIKSREIFEALNIPMYQKEGFEADDMIGTLVEAIIRHQVSKNVDIIIASGDMDTLQLTVGDKVRVYTLKKGIKDTIIYNEQAVIERFGFSPKLLPDYKGLRGDPSDNIIGIKGIGEKTAQILIQNFGSIEDIYKKLKSKNGKEEFKKAGITDRIIDLLENGEEEALFSKMLGTIRRDAPIDFKIPEKTWVEEIDDEKILKIWSELEFRTLGTRLKEVLGKVSGKDNLTPTLSSTEAREQAVKTNEKLFADSELTDTELTEAKIALWLINSNITNPKIEDIINMSAKKDLKEARLALLEELKAKKLDGVFDNIEKPLIPIIKNMEEKGIVVDKELLQKLSVENHKILNDLEKKIWNLAGGEFNINSPKQMSEILFVKMGLTVKNQKKTAGGKVSTKESELEKMKDLHPIIALILEYRELQKMLSTYIDNIPQMVASDGRLHAKFLQTGTTTGRISSQDPNLQNIPNKGILGMEVRKAFKATSGHKLVAFDYSQIELRIAAFLSGDQKLLEIFRNNEDVHTAVASEVFNVPLDQVDKEMRRRAKVINFGIMYGMGVSALKQNLTTDTEQVSRADAEKFYNDYFTKFSGLASYLDAVKSDAVRIGYTETLFGRRRYFEGIKSKIPFIRAMNERMAINAPVQGTGADITKLAMIKVNEYLQTTSASEGHSSLTKEEKANAKLSDYVHLLLQVHDELVFEIPTDLIETVAPKIKELMEQVADLEKTKGVVCKVEYKVGDNWGEMQKI